jgi:phosphomannomutase
VASIESVFKAYDIRGKVGDQLNPNFALNVGCIFADWLPTKGIIAVGYDMRPDSKELANAFINGLVKQGRDVWNIGLVTSDMIYFAIGKYNLAGGAVITASHNPGADNGIKLYRDKVTPVGLDNGLAQIRDNYINKQIQKPPETSGNITPKDITDDWVKHCLTFVNNIKPFNIAIDAGNGMAGKILPHILPKLPISAKQMYFKLDGTFPNHEANPQKPENLKDLASEVTKNKLDFGIAFDGDGDRAGFVDNKGRPVWGTDLITIVAKHYLKKYPGSEIIHDVRTSRATTEFIKKWGGTPIRAKAGRVNIGAMLRERSAPFGGETTGHFFFKENYDADSGLITALVAMQAISQSGSSLSDLVDNYRKYAIIPEANFTCKNKVAVFNKLKKLFKDGEQDELDGLTVNYPDYWFNLRSSNTEPVMRLNAEANNQKLLNDVVVKISKIIKDIG